MSETIRIKQVTTRKPHKCWGCSREFPAGSNLKLVVFVDGVIVSSYWCKVCNVVFTHVSYDMDNDTIGEGELRNLEPELWNETAAAMELPCQ